MSPESHNTVQYLKRIPAGISDRSAIVFREARKVIYHLPSLAACRKVPEVAAALRKRFSESYFREIARVLPPEERQALEMSCSALLNGDWSEFTSVPPFLDKDGVPHWHIDPLTGKNWPPDLGYKVDYQSEKRPGDIRLLWELNRHLVLVILALGSVILGEDKYLEYLKRIWFSWRQKNPPFRGIAWIGPQIQENAIRNISWIWTYLILQDQKKAKPFLDELREMICIQGKFLRFFFRENKKPSHNHLISEAAGLAITGLFFSSSPMGKKWFRKGKRTLEKSILFQCHPDGVQGEFSVNYHAFVLESALQTLVLSRIGGEEFSPAFRERLTAMIQHLGNMVYPDGRLPAFGDTDNANSLALLPNRQKRWGRLQATGAVLFESKLKPGAFPVCNLETLVLAGPERTLALAEKIKESDHVENNAEFYPSMNTLVSAFAGGFAEKLIFRGGGTAFPEGIGISHNHSDLLGFTYWADGKEWLTDPGTFLYSGEDKWRYYFRSTTAHNTISIDGEDILNVKARRFGIPGIFPTQLVEKEIAVDMRRIVVAFTRPQDPRWRHTRLVIHLKQGIIILRDYLEISSKHMLSQYFQVDSPLTRFQENGLLVLKNTQDPGIVMYFPGKNVEINIYHGDHSRPAGWSSRRYGQKKEISTVERKMPFTDRLVLDTVITYGRHFNVREESTETVLQDKEIRIEYRHGSGARVVREANIIMIPESYR